MSGVVDLDDMDTVWDVMDALRLLIEPAMDGLGMAVEAVEAELTLRILEPGLPSSADLFRKVKNWGKPLPTPASLEVKRAMN